MALIGTFAEFNETKEKFHQYYNRFIQFLKANAITNEERQSAIFLTVIGTQTYHLLESLCSPTPIEELSLQQMSVALSKHFQPRPLIIMETFHFLQRLQQPNETAAQYLAALRQLAINCEFDTYLERALRDKFVQGLNNVTIQRRMLTEVDLTVNKALEIAQSMEMADQKSKELHSLSSLNEHVDRVYTKPDSSQHKMSPPGPCPRCGKASHWSRDCRYKDAVCHYCKAKGHIQPACRKFLYGSTSNTGPNLGSTHFTSRQRTSRPHKRRSAVTTNAIDDDSGALTDDDTEATANEARNIAHLSLHNVCQVQTTQQKGPTCHEHHNIMKTSITINSTTHPIWVNVIINQIPIQMEFDTGAGVTLVNKMIWQNILGAPKLFSVEDISLSAYGGIPIEVIGQTIVSVNCTNTIMQLPLVVVNGVDKPLLGRNWMPFVPIDWAKIKQNLVRLKRLVHVDTIASSVHKLRQILIKHKELFTDGIGHCTKIKAHISLKEGVAPKFYKARPVPFSLQKKVDEELDRLENLGIISKVSHSDWAAPIVPILKPNGSIRICGGFNLTINPCINVEQYPLPKPEHLFHALNGGQEFNKLDLADAYLQCELDEPSKKLCIINTHRGLYQYNRLPFGVSSASAIFQQVIDKITNGIPFTVAFQDDVVSSGPNTDASLANLDSVLSRLQEYGMRIRKQKCKFLQPEIEYLGFILCAQGRRPVPSKTEAIQKMRSPRNVGELRSFLGMVTFYHSFIPDMSTVADPLNRLLRTGVTWSWGRQQQSAFNLLKSKLTSTKILVHYDPNLPLGLACDASQSGLGAVLFHKFPDNSEKPIAFASCTLNSAQRNYSQIEREAAAIIFGVEKFYQYLWGRKFLLITDHKPLLAIFGPKNGFPERTAHRLQRWAIKLGAYQYTIIYRSTEKHGNADGLSRIPLENNFFLNQEDVEIHDLQSETLESVPIANYDIRRATEQDPILNQVKVFMRSTWPDKIENPEIMPFYSHRNMISEHAGCLLLGSRIIIPKKLQQRILLELHEGHLGVVKMKSVAREHIWWPSIDKSIETCARRCSACAEHANDPPKTRFHTWQRPEKPWQRIHLDYAGPFLGTNFLVIIDSFSKWPEVFQCANTTSARTISELRKTFARFGLPHILVTDNGSQFMSAEFQTFLRANGIAHKTTAAYHPATNGLAERFVETLKKALSIAGDKPLDLALQSFLLAYRNAVHPATHDTPANLMLQFRPQTKLDLLRPQSVPHTTTVPFAKSVRSFRKDDPVWIRIYNQKNKWAPGIISNVLGDVHFEITTPFGNVKRHIDQIRKREPNAYTNAEHYQDDQKTSSDWPHFPVSKGATTFSATSQNTNPPSASSPAFDTTSRPNDSPSAAKPNADEAPRQRERNSANIEQKSFFRRHFLSPTKRKQMSPPSIPNNQQLQAMPDNPHMSNDANVSPSDPESTSKQVGKYLLRKSPKLSINSILLTCVMLLIFMPFSTAYWVPENDTDIVHYNYTSIISDFIRLTNTGDLKCESALNFLNKDISARQRNALPGRHKMSSFHNSNEFLFILMLIMLCLLLIILVLVIRCKRMNCPCKVTLSITPRRHRYPRSLPTTTRRWDAIHLRERTALEY